MSQQPSKFAAHAPYNFVPLPETAKVADPAPPANSHYPNKTKPEERFSGYIGLTLTTKSPIFIRGTRSDKEVENRVEAKDKPQFFQPGGTLRIPGSSLRGMTRSLVEILSASKMEFVGNQQLFYRAVADQVGQSIAQHYRDRVNFDDPPKVHAGFIGKQGSTYSLYPIQAENAIFRVEIDTVAKEAGLQRIWARQRVWFVIPSDGENLVTQIIKRTTEDTPKSPNGEVWHKGRYIAPGPMSSRNKKGEMKEKSRNWIILDEGWQNAKIDLAYEDIFAYRESGLTRLIKENRMSVLPTEDGVLEAIPCFFYKWTDQKNVLRIAFGHTGYFRLPYEHDAQDRVPQDMREGQIDLAEALFGVATDTRNERKEGRAGRVFFEDAMWDRTTNGVENADTMPRILSTPKPTTFQHYLEQPESLRFDTRTRDGREAAKEALRFWDRDGNVGQPPTRIRGHKLYWHRPDAEWRETESKFVLTPGVPRLNNERKPILDTQHTLIRPVKKGARFTAHVRFENLLDYELGALLFALDLPSGFAHKLGMGKPLGLGSVRLDCELHLINRQERYATLFDGDGWHTGEAPETGNASPYKKAFLSRFVGANATEENVLTIGRLRELGAMLSLNPLPPNARVDYMPLDDFKARLPLPMPHEVRQLPTDASDKQAPQSPRPMQGTQPPRPPVPAQSSPRQSPPPAQRPAPSQPAPPKDSRIAAIDALDNYEVRRGKAGTIWQQCQTEKNTEMRRTLACRLKTKLSALGLLDTISTQKWAAAFLEETKDC